MDKRHPSWRRQAGPRAACDQAGLSGTASLCIGTCGARYTNWQSACRATLSPAKRRLRNEGTVLHKTLHPRLIRL
eukprot:1147341-Pyramimonas_sp.AAC.1